MDFSFTFAFYAVNFFWISSVGGNASTQDLINFGHESIDSGLSTLSNGARSSATFVGVSAAFEWVRKYGLAILCGSNFQLAIGAALEEERKSLCEQVARGMSIERAALLHRNMIMLVKLDDIDAVTGELKKMSEKELNAQNAAISAHFLDFLRREAVLFLDIRKQYDNFIAVAAVGSVPSLPFVGAQRRRKRGFPLVHCVLPLLVIGACLGVIFGVILPSQNSLPHWFAYLLIFACIGALMLGMFVSYCLLKRHLSDDCSCLPCFHSSRTGESGVEMTPRH